jgi:hypothetical protein
MAVYAGQLLSLKLSVGCQGQYKLQLPLQQLMQLQHLQLDGITVQLPGGEDSPGADTKGSTIEGDSSKGRRSKGRSSKCKAAKAGARRAAAKTAAKVAGWQRAQSYPACSTWSWLL